MSSTQKLRGLIGAVVAQEHRLYLRLVTFKLNTACWCLLLVAGWVLIGSEVSAVQQLENDIIFQKFFSVRKEFHLCFFNLFMPDNKGSDVPTAALTYRWGSLGSIYCSLDLLLSFSCPISAMRMNSWLKGLCSCSLLQASVSITPSLFYPCFRKWTINVAVGMNFEEQCLRFRQRLLIWNNWWNKV